MASQSILEQKRTQIDAIKEQIKNAKGLVIVNYIGLTVAEDTAFRKSLRTRHKLFGSQKPLGQNGV